MPDPGPGPGSLGDGIAALPTSWEAPARPPPTALYPAGYAPDGSLAGFVAALPESQLPAPVVTSIQAEFAAQMQPKVQLLAEQRWALDRDDVLALFLLSYPEVRRAVVHASAGSDPDALDRWRPLRFAIDRARGRLDHHPEVVYCVVGRTFPPGTYEAGRYVRGPAVCLGTTVLRVAQDRLCRQGDCADPDGDGRGLEPGTLFVLQTHAAHRLSLFSRVAGEEDVLLPAHPLFRVRLRPEPPPQPPVGPRHDVVFLEEVLEGETAPTGGLWAGGGGEVEATLKGMERCPADVVVQEVGCALLAQVATTAEGRQRIMDCAGPWVVLQALRTGHAGTQVYGLRALNRLLAAGVSSHTEASLSLGLGVVLHGLQHSRRAEAVQAGGLELLCWLAKRVENRHRIVHFKGIPIVCDAMRMNVTNPSIQLYGCQLLRCLSADAAYGAAIATAGGMEAVLVALQQYGGTDPQLRVAGTSALAQLLSSPDHVERCARAGGVPVLLQSLVSDPVTEQLVFNVSWSLAALARHAPGQASLLQHGGLEALVAVLRDTLALHGAGHETRLSLATQEVTYGALCAVAEGRQYQTVLMEAGADAVMAETERSWLASTTGTQPRTATPKSDTGRPRPPRPGWVERMAAPVRKSLPEIEEWAPPKHKENLPHLWSLAKPKAAQEEPLPAISIARQTDKKIAEMAERLSRNTRKEKLEQLTQKYYPVREQKTIGDEALKQMADRLSHQDARADQLQYKYYPMLMPFVMTDEEIEESADRLWRGALNTRQRALHRKERPPHPATPPKRAPSPPSTAAAAAPRSPGPKPRTKARPPAVPAASPSPTAAATAVAAPLPPVPSPKAASPPPVGAAAPAADEPAAAAEHTPGQSEVPAVTAAAAQTPVQAAAAAAQMPVAAAAAAQMPATAAAAVTQMPVTEAEAVAQMPAAAAAAGEEPAGETVTEEDSRFLFVGEKAVFDDLPLDGDPAAHAVSRAAAHVPDVERAAEFVEGLAPPVRASVVVVVAGTATTDPLLSELLQSLSSGPTACPALVLYPEDLALSVDLARFNDPPYVVVTSDRSMVPFFLARNRQLPVTDADSPFGRPPHRALPAGWEADLRMVKSKLPVQTVTVTLPHQPNLTLSCVVQCNDLTTESLPNPEACATDGRSSCTVALSALSPDTVAVYFFITADDPGDSPLDDAEPDAGQRCKVWLSVATEADKEEPVSLLLPQSLPEAGQGLLAGRIARTSPGAWCVTNCGGTSTDAVAEAVQAHFLAHPIQTYTP